MKRVKVTYDGELGAIRREVEAEGQLTGEQKYHLLLAAMLCPTVCVIITAFFRLFQ